MTVAVLAGGQSRRMGQDKTTLAWEGAPLLDHALGLARAAGARELAICGSAARPGCTTLTDAVRGRGPLGGILAAVRWRPCVLVLACDMPLVPPSFLIWLWQRAADFTGWTLPASQPLCAVYTAALRPWLERAAARAPEEPVGPLAAILAAAPRQILTDFDATIFANLNTPAEYAAARSVHA